jgi:hypothetical protein
MFRGEVLGVLAVFSRKPVFTVNRFAAGPPTRCSGQLYFIPHLILQNTNCEEMQIDILAF